MEVVYLCCCGLDVHKKSITACVLWAEAKGKSRKEKKRFGTFTHDLLQLADWLQECGVTHVAMESTGVYWKPVWNILAEQFEVLLVNAQHIQGAVAAKKRTGLTRHYMFDTSTGSSTPSTNATLQSTFFTFATAHGLRLQLNE